MSSIWFTSDTHYGHKNICRGTTSWDLKEKDGHNKTRDFKTLEEMNQAIVKGINSKVKYNDVLYHLGDWSFGGVENIWNFRKQIICNNIFLILGNHDQHIENNKELPNAWMKCNGTMVGVGEGAEEGDEQVVAQDLFTYVRHVHTLKVKEHSIFMSHYSHRTWNKSHKGTLHVYGHSHGSLEGVPHGKSMDVGIDAYYKLYGKYEPFHLNQVVDILSKRDIMFIDHHQTNTN
jgi:calcineurin-like phosphoesterase family protein